MRLYNFPVSRWVLQTDHRQWLSDVAVRFLNENSAHSFKIIGMTSRSGPEAYNQTLSEKRADEVFQFLKKHHLAGQIETRLGDGVVGGGEKYAETAGMKDNSENPYFRAVDIWLLKNLFDYQEFRSPIRIPDQIPGNNTFA
jgi:outer membrane protein OmpA-like peptidoglycan-associated protein